MGFERINALGERVVRNLSKILRQREQRNYHGKTFEINKGERSGSWIKADRNSRVEWLFAERARDIETREIDVYRRKSQWIEASGDEEEEKKTGRAKAKTSEVQKLWKWNVDVWHWRSFKEEKKRARWKEEAWRSGSREGKKKESKQDERQSRNETTEIKRLGGGRRRMKETGGTKRRRSQENPWGVEEEGWHNKRIEKWKVVDWNRWRIKSWRIGK